MSEATAITCVQWMRRGVSKKNPTKHQMTEEEWCRIKDELGEPDLLPMEEPKEDPRKGKGLDMDNYDNDEGEGMQFFSNLNERDMDASLDAGEVEEDSEDEECNVIQDADTLLLAANVEDDACSLEVYLYMEDDCNMYVHHDILLPAYPLAIEWMQTAKGQKGSYAAIGSFNPYIDIWDLDQLEVCAPTARLGEVPNVQKKSKTITAGQGHTDAVMSLSTNPHRINVLASGSADSTVKLWDVNEEKCADTLRQHKDKVQCVAWHQKEEAILLSAGFDQKLHVVDVRQSNKTALTVKLPADAECAVWSMANPEQIFSSTEDGQVRSYDIRQAADSKDKVKPLWSVQAHGAPCTAVRDHADVPGMLVTCGIDGMAKIWNTKIGSSPVNVSERDLHSGPIFSCSIAHDEPALISFGGTQVTVWDIRENDHVKKTFFS